LRRAAAIAAIGWGAAGCSITLPMMSLATKPEPEPVVLTTASVGPSATRRADTPLLDDHLGPEDLRRAMGALALALDPQGNGQPVGWDNAESKASGRFTPVGGPFLSDDEVCRAFLTHVALPLDRHHYQGTACRPSGGDWRVREMKAWRAP
jgi:hypothetical protein